MPNDIELCYKYQTLFELFNSQSYPDVDTVIITGGRYSLKSYTVSIFSLIALVDYNWSVLYTRFTNSTIIDSIKPEVSDKIDLLGFRGKVIDTNTHIEKGLNRIAFKGIKTGSREQTANLKSLSGFNCFVNDEAEELPDYKTFKKIFYSIRSTEKRNLTILILNPTTKDHWIFQEFFEKKGLQGGENTIVDNVLYIHASYLDGNLQLMPKNILADYNRMKIDSPDEYENIVLGGWIQEPEGVLLPKSRIKFYTTEPKQEQVVFRFLVGDPADTGGDTYSIPFFNVVQHDKDLFVYVPSVIHNTYGIEANTSRILDRVKEHHTEQLFIESNGVGLAAILLIKSQLNTNQKLSPFPSTVNKEVRIYSHYEFVQKHFLFNEYAYKSDEEYRTYVNELTGYTKDGDNKHRKDAIDSACLAASIIKIKYAKFIYGT